MAIGHNLKSAFASSGGLSVRGAGRIAHTGLKEDQVVKTNWGLKRQCLSCGARFYDMQKHPVTCPKCAAIYDPDSALRGRRSRPAVEKEEERPKKKKGEAAVVIDALEAEEDLGEDGLGEEDEDLIEDASELGEDEDDMVEVIENAEGEGEE